MRNFFNRYISVEYLVHGIKATIATLLAIFLMYIFGRPGDIWVVITVVLIMCSQFYVGSVFKTGFFRFLGTLIGCLFAAITLLAFKVTPLSIMLSVSLSVFIFSYLASSREDFAYTATLGAVTTALIMLWPSPSLLMALQRFIEISAGILIATLVSQFFLPIHASTHLRRTQAKTFLQLRDFYQTTLMKEQVITNLQEQEENIVKLLLKQRKLAKESRVEPFKHSFDYFHFMRLLYCEREILRAICFMHTAFMHVKNKHDLNRANFHSAIIQALSNLGKRYATKNSSEVVLIPSLDDLKKEWGRYTHDATPQSLLYLNGYLFSAEVLLDNLNKINHLQQ